MEEEEEEHESVKPSDRRKVSNVYGYGVVGRRYSEPVSFFFEVFLSCLVACVAYVLNEFSEGAGEWRNTVTLVTENWDERVHPLVCEGSMCV